MDSTVPDPSSGGTSVNRGSVSPDAAAGPPVALSAPRYGFTFGVYDQTAAWSDVRFLTWLELVDLLTRHPIGQKAGTAIVPSVFDGGKRTKLKARQIDVAFLDSDSGATLVEIAASIRALGLAGIISSTHSHLTTTTRVKRGAFEAWLDRNGTLGAPESVEAYLIGHKRMLPRIAIGATIADQTDTEIIISHAPCPKFRVALPLARPWVAAAYESQTQATKAWERQYGALANLIGLQHDPSCSDASRLFFLPRRPADGPAAETRVIEGTPVDIFGLIPVEVDERNGARRKSKSERGAHPKGQKEPKGSAQSYSDPDTGEILNLRAWARKSGRYFQIVQALRARSPGVFVGRVADGVRHHIVCPNSEEHTNSGADTATFVSDPRDSGEGGFVIHCRHGHCTGIDRLVLLRKMLEQRSLFVEDLRNPEFQPRPDDRDDPWPDDDLTEHKVAAHFARRAAANLRYCHTRGAWFVWTGAYWRQNQTRLAFHWIRRMATKLNAHAMPNIAVATSRASFVSAVERFAQADPLLAVTDTAWNSDPWLLATPHGTVDLRDGILREPRQDDLISRSTAVAPDKAGNCPKWQAFLKEASGNDAEVVAFIQRWLGYCLTGVTREHALLFVFGPGGNGKGVLLITANGILMEYAVTAALDTFTAAHGERHSTEIAMLAGARFVMTTETEEGRSWAEARIKALTGGDPVTARFMRQDNFTFTPVFKLTISGNHKPSLKNVDDAARRRFLILHFLHKPATPNRHLVDELREEWPGILRWMINGCLAWQRHGLNPPAAVLAATADYFAAQDMFAQWLDDRCEQGKQWGTAVADLYRSWTSFLADNGEAPRSQRSFGTLLEGQGFAKAKDCAQFRGRGYLGLRLRPAEPEAHWSETDR